MSACARAGVPPPEPVECARASRAEGHECLRVPVQLCRACLFVPATTPSPPGVLGCAVFLCVDVLAAFAAISNMCPMSEPCFAPKQSGSEERGGRLRFNSSAGAAVSASKYPLGAMHGGPLRHQGRGADERDPQRAS